MGSFLRRCKPFWFKFTNGSTVQLITKVYFPRLIIPLAAVGSAWVDFVVSLFLLLPFAFVYGMRPEWGLLLIPPVMIVTMILATGIGMVLAALNVRYRDFQYIIPFLLQVWLYASPVVYSVQIVPKQFLFWYYLNPMSGLLDVYLSGTENFLRSYLRFYSDKSTS